MILPLREVGKGHWSLVGGKAARLASMMRAGLPVPPGFCITVAAFRQFLDGCSPRMDCVFVSQQTSEPLEQAVQIGEETLACLNRLDMPSEVREAILRAWRSNGVDRAYAVRSSAPVEDGSDHSFAGQFETFLDVRGQDALLAAVKQCWLSCFSARAAAYRARHHPSAALPAMAVVVQEMIPADVAGVLFTIDPATGDASRIVVEAARGLGDRIVQGEVAPDRIILDKSSCEIVGKAAGVSGDKMILDDAAARKLAILSRQVEKDMASAVDIEWAMRDGELYFLQARPVTGQQRSETGGRLQIWTNANAAEAIPEPITPLTYSMLMPFLQGMFDSFMNHLGISIRAEQLISLIAGRPYFNANLGSALLCQMPGIKIEDIGEIFGGAHEPMARKGLIRLRKDDLPRLRFYPWQVICGMPPVIVAVMKFLFSNKAHTIPMRPPSPNLVGTNPYGTISDKALLSAIHAALPTDRDGRDPRLRSMGIGALCLVIFFALSKRWFGADGAAIASRLTAGLGTLDPAEVGRDLWRLAEYARDHPRVRQAVREAHAFAVLERRLLDEDEGKEFLSRWRIFLGRHGHHARGEIELMNPRWNEMPDTVLALVRDYLEAMIGNLPVPAARLSELGHQRAALEGECFRRLKNPLKRLLFRRVMDWARRGVAIKENTKSQLIRRIYHARLLLLELGHRLVERGRCTVRDDIFFLKTDELRYELLFNGNKPLSDITGPRRAEHDHNLALNPPPVIIGHSDPSTWQAESSASPAEHLEGLAVSPGIARGQARVILKASTEDRVLPGEILVVPTTDPAWSPYFLTAAGVAIDLGGMLSHGSILAREYGLPAVTNLGSATRSIRTGDWIEVDGNIGRVRILRQLPPG